MFNFYSKCRVVIVKKKLFSGVVFVSLFIVWTIILLLIDRQRIGPNNSVVGLATINKWFHELTGVNWNLYSITDWGAIIPISLGILFGILGLIQWFKRKKVSKVDKELIILGVFYFAVFLLYLMFEFIVVNKRPVLIDGYLEVSYPSSTTFLSITFMLSAIIPIKKYLTNNSVKVTLIVAVYVYMLFLLIGRLLSGVHWFTDVVGSIFIGIGLLNIYEYFATNKQL